MTISSARRATTENDRFARLVLGVDGVATGLTGILLLPSAGILDPLLGLPAGLLIGFAVFFVVYGASLLLLSRRPVVRRGAVLGVVTVNLLFAVDTAITLAAGWFDLTLLGTVACTALGVIVAGFGTVQARAARGL